MVNGWHTTRRERRALREADRKRLLKERLTGAWTVLLFFVVAMAGLLGAAWWWGP